MKKLLIPLLLFAVNLYGCCQTPDHDFKVPIKVISIQYPDGTIQTTAGGTGIVDWASVTNKPTTFPPSVHNHDALYKPISYVPPWAEITNKPAEIDLQAAILTLQGLAIPRLTTVQINALTPSEGILVWDTTLKVMKVGSGTAWKVLITAN